MIQSRQIYISDTIHNTILLSTYEKELISTQLFNRLHNISQNSTAYLTFPTNRTKRFEHSLGAMYLCGEIIRHSFVNTDKEIISKILSDFKDSIISKIIKEKILFDPDKYRNILSDSNLVENKLCNFDSFYVDSVFYRNLVPSNIEKKDVFTYLLLLQSVRIVALLHDIGHPPFSHITESAMQEIYEQLTFLSAPNDRQTNYLETFAEYDFNRNSSQLHEKMGEKMTNAMISDILFNDSSWHHSMKFDEKYFKILLFETVKLIFKEATPVLGSLHKVVDGALDGDRLDYVCRDFANSGISNGKLEYDRLILSMRIFYHENPTKYFFVPDAKTANTLDEFFLKRWNLYKNIIFHHRVIKTDSLLKNCVKNIIIKYLDSSLKESSDASVKYVLPDDISGLWKAIKLASSNTMYFNSLIQWDDAWLNTILKKIYFSEYYQNDTEVRLQLEELLSNKKNYYSVIKNLYDFNILNEEFLKHFKENIITENEVFMLIDEVISNQYDKASIFYKLDKYFITTSPKKDFNFKAFIRNSVAQFLKEEFQEIYSHIIEFKTIKTGFSVEPNVYKDGELLPLSKISNIKNILESQQYTFPYLYIYLNSSNTPNQLSNDSFRKDFLTKLGKFLANKLLAFIEK